MLLYITKGEPKISITYLNLLLLFLIFYLINLLLLYCYTLIQSILVTTTATGGRVVRASDSSTKGPESITTTRPTGWYMRGPVPETVSGTCGAL